MITMKNVIAISALGFLFLLQSCSKDVLKGDGTIRTETRALTSFTSVDISGNRNVEIIKSDTKKVEVTGFDNLIGSYESKVDNGTLTFGFVNHWRVKNDNISLKIYTPDFSEIRLSGNNTVTIGAGFNLNDFEASMSGNGKLYFSDGTVNNLTIKSSGNGETHASNLVSQYVRVEISGNGTAEVNAVKTLSVRISGNGEVHYWGNPEVNSSISGNGKTIKH